MRKILLGVAMAVGLMCAASFANPAMAVDCATNPNAPDCPCAGQTTGVCTDLKDSGKFNSNIKAVINILLYGVSIVAVIMAVVSGIRWITSAGNVDNATKARHTLIYSVIGVAVAALAYVIVNFVVGLFG